MGIYDICDLRVKLCPEGKELNSRASKFFIYEDGEFDFSICPPPALIDKLYSEYAFESRDFAEYQQTSIEFSNRILNYGGFILHASAVLYEGFVYLFSAPCGTGKSTHANIWEREFGALVINDDKPVIMKKDGKFCAFGTPWCGTSTKCVPLYAPIKAIYFLERANDNSAEEILPSEAIYRILESTARPDEKKLMSELLSAIDGLLKAVKIKKLYCNISSDAARLAFEAAQ